MQSYWLWFGLVTATSVLFTKSGGLTPTELLEKRENYSHLTSSFTFWTVINVFYSIEMLLCQIQQKYSYSAESPNQPILSHSL